MLCVVNAFFRVTYDPECYPFECRGDHEMRRAVELSARPEQRFVLLDHALVVELFPKPSIHLVL